MEQEYDKLNLTNDFIFAKVMRNKELCKRLLEIVLDIEIEKIEYPEEQKAIDITINAKSVRLDVYVKDDRNTIYNIEMQTTNPQNLPKRSRYYQGMIDLDLIEKGENYKKLNRSYVIFICTEDIFGGGRHIYTFENLCIQNTSLRLRDETTKVFLNPYGTMKDIHEELENFLNYLVNGKPTDRFTEMLDNEVVKVRENEEWRREYMTLMMKEMEKYEEGLERGRSEGRDEGRKEGHKEGTLTTLFTLVHDGLLGLEEAAKYSSLPEGEFAEKMKQVE